MSFSIFTDKLVVDDREPILTATFLGENLGLFLPRISFWIQGLPILIVCACFSVLMATITYAFIIPRRGSMISYLVGFGVIIPLCIGGFPFWFLDFIDVRNKLLRFVVSSVYPVLTMFRTSEAMFGFSPPTVESSYKNYIIYYAAAVEIQYDNNKKCTIASTRHEKKESLKSVGKFFIILGLFNSVFGPYHYEMFQTSTNGNQPGFDLKECLDWRLFCNNYIGTLLFQLYLSTFGNVLDAIVKVVFGIKIKGDMMKNPVMTASSPSDFWSNRWNKLVHSVLKRGVFKPVYSVSSKLVAVCATFLVSGVFHEFILLAIHPPHLDFEPIIGKQTGFMMWNAGVIIIEALVSHARIFKWIKASVPAPLLTILVLCTAMPAAHWFIHPYTKSQMFVHGELAFPIIKAVK